MTKAAIISGSLVDVRNVGTHKSVKLTIHVPEELAMKVMEAFGWPTGVSPVAVAIARLEEPVSRQPPPSRPLTAADKPGRSAQPTVPTAQVVRADKERRKFVELPHSTAAALRCNDPVFRAFLREMCGARDAIDADTAAKFVRARCHVASRSDIKPDTEAETYWLEIEEWFEAWKIADRVSA